MTEAERWWKDANDAYLLRGVTLGGGAHVMDVGGYKGDFTALMREKFHAVVRVYEPVPEFCDYLVERFKSDHAVDVRRYGLGENPRKQKIALMDDASTFHSPLRGDAPSVEIEDVLVESRIYFGSVVGVDLMALNVEGSEYEILHRLISSGAMRNVRQLLVQFHRVYRDSDKRREEIRLGLAMTHDEVWSYPFVWEFWKRRA